MQKLIDKYNKECSIKSRFANFIWKFGIILITIIFFISAIIYKENNYAICYFIIIIILFGISHVIFVLDIGKKLKIEKKSKFLISLKYMRKVYKEIDIFQKQWIKKNCKNNKFNTVNKIENINK